MNNYPDGVWPVMLTPFTAKGEIDEDGLCSLIEWYIKNGVSGLFASCQSSEIYKLSFNERIRIAKITKKQVAGRVPVVASGHVSDDFDEQERELNAMAETGVDAVIMITNHFAHIEESDAIWMKNVDRMLARIDPKVHLGAYECPMPYKRVMSPEMIQHIAQTDRFYFIKDTCYDVEAIRKKLAAVKGTNLKIYNANTTTLLQSMLDGASGYSGIMANFHPELYVWLVENIHHPNAQKVQQILSIAALIERQLYPANAKFHLKEIEHLPISNYCRVQDVGLLCDTFKTEVYNMDELCNDVFNRYCKQ